ncbi:MAG: PAS domain S-box protein [Desulfobacterales bacterium]|nr:PAS domain S-box protein [Desulfobacterales bacterium]
MKKIKALEKENGELKGREADLEERYSKCLQLMADLNEVIYTLDQNAKVTFVSPNVEKIGGYTPEEIIGRSFTDFVYPDDIEGRFENFQKILNGEQIATEYRYVKKDGSLVWVLTNAAPIFREGELLGIQGMLVNIDERKRAEESLRESEYRYRTLFEKNLNPIAIIDKQGRYLDANPAFLRFVETSKEILLKKNVFDFSPFENKDQMISEHQALWQTGGTVETEYLVNGKSKILELTVSPIDFKGCEAVIGVGKDVTEHKKAQEALIRAESKWRQILVQTPQIGVSINPDGKISFANEYFLRLTGWDEQEVMGQNWFDCFIPEYIREAVRGVFQNVIRDRDIKEFSSYENEIVTKYGELRNVSWSNVITRDARGDVIDVTCLGLDLTERKKAEEAIRKSEERFRTILESMEDGYFEVDLAGNFTFFNEAMRRMLGFTEDEMMGMNNRKFMDKANAKKVFETFNRVYRMGEPYRAFDWELIRKDGAISNIDTSVSLVRDEAGQAVGFRGIARDVTEKKRAEKALQQSERQKNLILNSTSEKVIYYSPDLRVIWANRAAGQSAGKSEKELVDLSCREMWCQENAPCAFCAVQRAKDTKAPQFSEKHTPDGRIWDIRAYPILDDDGMVEALAVFGQEITEKKRAEQERARLEEQINQAQKLESIGRLAGGVAHDLNNLLSPILGYSEMLLQARGPADSWRGNLKEILKAGERARDLVQQLLAFGRKQMLEFKSLDLNDLLKNFDKFLRRTIRENVDINIQLAPSLPPVKGDPGQLEQVIMNLAINAQDAMPDGGKMSIETAVVELDQSYAAEHPDVTPGPHVRLTVMDTGYGMDEETLEAIFEPFYTTKELGKGTGLGLATVYGIVKQHGGNIWAYSEPGRGTTFRVYLPESADRLEETEAGSQSKLLGRGGAETILLVEDNHQVRDLSRSVLEEKGYKVLAAETGEVAIELLESHKGSIDLLLTDVVMPEMDGKQLFERVSGLYPGIRVVYMSGYTVDVIAHHGVIDTGVNFLQKPFAIKDLAAKVREALDS